MRKPKPLPFKKGMKVIWLNRHDGRISLTEGEVTVVTTKNGEPIIHCRHIDRFGNEWKCKFSPACGHFQQDPHPIWQLQPLNGRSVKALRKRAEKCTKRNRVYQEAYDAMRRDVEEESRTWQRDEVSRRGDLISDGPKFVENVIARMGFKKPKVQKFNF